MSRKISLCFLIPLILLSACSTSRMAVQVTPENHHTADYIEKYAAVAVNEMKRTGIPASIKLAQGMIESDYGRSRLARVANNHFGIKCHNNWRGPVIYHDDDAKDECFRKYSRPEESFRDHSDFLVSGSRYRFLFELEPTDYKGWARGLKKAGYATNPVYADMLIKKIETNRLYLFDTGSEIVAADVTGDKRKPQAEVVAVPAKPQNQLLRGQRYRPSVAGRVNMRNRVEYIVASETDTPESLMRDFELKPWELEKYNEKPVSELVFPGSIIYLQPKRKRAELWVRYHIVREGESMYYISQLYAVRLKNLYKMNFIDEGSEPEPGRKINLR